MGLLSNIFARKPAAPPAITPAQGIVAPRIQGGASAIVTGAAGSHFTTKGPVAAPATPANASTSVLTSSGRLANPASATQPLKTQDEFQDLFARFAPTDLLRFFIYHPHPDIACIANNIDIRASSGHPAFTTADDLRRYGILRNPELNATLYRAAAEFLKRPYKIEKPAINLGDYQAPKCGGQLDLHIAIQKLLQLPTFEQGDILDFIRTHPKLRPLAKQQLEYSNKTDLTNNFLEFARINNLLEPWFHRDVWDYIHGKREFGA